MLQRTLQCLLGIAFRRLRIIQAREYAGESCARERCLLQCSSYVSPTESRRQWRRTIVIGALPRQSALVPPSISTREAWVSAGLRTAPEPPGICAAIDGVALATCRRVRMVSAGWQSSTEAAPDAQPAPASTRKSRTPKDIVGKNGEGAKVHVQVI